MYETETALRPLNLEQLKHLPEDSEDGDSELDGAGEEFEQEDCFSADDDCGSDSDESDDAVDDSPEATPFRIIPHLIQPTRLRRSRRLTSRMIDFLQSGM